MSQTTKRPYREKVNKIDIAGPVDLPPRTHVDISGTLPAFALRAGGRILMPYGGLETTFTCIDCGFQTKDRDEMIEHQEDQADNHTWRQRLKRWRAIRKARRASNA